MNVVSPKIYRSRFATDYKAFDSFPYYYTCHFPSVWIYQKSLPLEGTKVLSI